jgi:UDP-glucuronate 4-epimerase
VVRHKGQASSAKTASFVAMDLSRALDRGLLPAQVDVIIHLAQANVPFPELANDLFAVNTAATQQLLDYARRAGAKQFMLASTGDVYGRIYGPAGETLTPAPGSYYAATKYAAELLVQAYSNHFQTCSLRLFHPYGPGQSARLIPKIAGQIMLGKPIRLNKDSRPHVTPIFIDDVTGAVETVLASPHSGAINIAGDRRVSIRELAEEIGRVLEIEPAFEQTELEATDLAGDNRLMKELLGTWDLVGLSEGLVRMFKSEEATLWQARV